MVSKSRKEDLLLSKWIAAETIFHLKKNSYWNKIDWVSNTKLHKIIFNVADKFNLPITRSWYIHGAYIHDYEDLSSNFSNFVNTYINSIRGPIIYRAKVKNILIDFDLIYPEIIKITEEINSYKTNEYLNKLYQTETPLKYRDAYISKHKFTDDESNTNKLIMIEKSFNDMENFSLKLINNIYDDISDFTISIFNTFDERKLENNTRIFFDFFEDALRKMEVSIIRTELSYTNFCQFFSNMNFYFTYDVWKPYACNITSDTVVGPWSNQVKTVNVKRWKQDSLNDFDKHIKIIKKQVIEYDFKTNYYDMMDYYSNKESSLIRDVLGLISTYEKEKDEL